MLQEILNSFYIFFSFHFVVVASELMLFQFKEMKKYGSMKHNSEWSKTRNTFGKIIFLVSLGGNAIAVVTGGTISLIAEKYYNCTPVAITGTTLFSIIY